MFILSDINISKLCYDLSLIYAKDSLNLLSPDDPYINKENGRIDYLYDAFEECYSFLSSQSKEYFKYLLK